MHAREKNQTAGRSLNKTCSKDAKENNFQHEDRGGCSPRLGDHAGTSKGWNCCNMNSRICSSMCASLPGQRKERLWMAFKQDVGITMHHLNLMWTGRILNWSNEPAPCCVHSCPGLHFIFDEFSNYYWKPRNSTDRIDGKLDATRNKTVEARDVASGDSAYSTLCWKFKSCNGLSMQTN